MQSLIPFEDCNIPANKTLSIQLTRKVQTKEYPHNFKSAITSISSRLPPFEVKALYLAFKRLSEQTLPEIIGVQVLTLTRNNSETVIGRIFGTAAFCRALADHKPLKFDVNQTTRFRDTWHQSWSDFFTGRILCPNDIHESYKYINAKNSSI